MCGLERVHYKDGDLPLTGCLARPTGTARAAILVLPTIANCTPAVQRRAAMLAEAGYLALIADFYGEAANDAGDPRALAEALRRDVDIYRGRLSAGLLALRALPDAKGLPLATIGYCMGGQAALELARSGADLACAVSFHGLLDTARHAEPDAIRARLLVCHGDADPMVPRGQVLTFWEEMDRAGADWHFHSYAGVRHGFTDPGSDARGFDAVKYNASADRQSWAAMITLFDELFE